jgi:class 3 adenylate cyclase/tetratricopeptide (TPR) repeat protein
MTCQNCGHENESDARFCSRCGHALSPPCPACGTLAEPGDRFCRNCGTALTESAVRPETEPSRPAPADDLSRYLPEELLAKMRSAREGHAMEGERRTVTMLFADVEGSTSSAEQLDPEDWAEIMNGAFERLISPIYRYEGTLAQLRGDAVLAFFGAPIAHEDDPVRAIRAGLEIMSATAEYSEAVERRWGVPAHVRVGIHTGLVVVGAMGSDLRVEYTALGDAINVAARMEQTAEPDTVRVTGHTLSLTKGVFQTEELGPINVKGKSQLVPAFRVLSYVGQAAINESGAMVGRSTELAKLDDVASQLQDGTGRIVSVIAEAGVGKTRLLDEFTHRVADKAKLARRFDERGDLNWLRGSTRSYDAANHYSSIAEILRHWWFGENSEPDFAGVEAAVAHEGLDDSDMATYMAMIAGVPLTEKAEGFIGSVQTQVLNSKANQAALSYFEAIAKRRPTFIVLEDLHWSDDLSLALVENLMTLTESVPIGLVVAMRPYREDSSWRIHEVAARDHPHRYTSLMLESLDAEASAELLDRLLGDSTVESRTKAGILERSQGNPLYIEQIVRAMGDDESGRLDENQVPSSLRGVLTARLDRLTETQRYLVQIASVIGSEFERDLLTSLVDTSGVDSTIADLLRTGILVEKLGHPAVLTFHHALIQEAAYETILRRTRRQLHRRVADQLIADDKGPAEIARHLVSADERGAAYPYLVAAGVSATRSMALADAIELLQSAIENTPDDADPELIVLAHETLGSAYALIPDLSQASASYQRLYDYGESSQRPEFKVSALNSLAYATASIGADLQKATEYLADARRIAEENHDELGLAEYHMNACMVASLGGDPGKAVIHDEETVRLGDKNGVAAVRLMGMVRRASNYIALLDWARGIPAVESALKEAAEFEQEEALATVRFSGSGTAKFAHGDISGALEETIEAIDTLDRFGSFFAANAHQHIGQCHLELGNVEDALSEFLETTRTGSAMGQPFIAATGASGMALIYATAGLIEEVPGLVSEAEEMISGPLGEFLASTVLADLGFVDLMLHQPEAAIERFTEGLNVSSITQFIQRPRLLIGRALSYLEAGEVAAAKADIEEAAEFAKDKELDLYLALIGLAEGLHLLATGSPDDAERSLMRAQEAALSRGQRVRLIEIQGARARAAQESGRDGDAAAHTESARSVVESIAAGISDEALRKSLVRRWQEAIAEHPQ